MSKNKFGIVAGIVFAASIVLSPVASACSLNDLSSCDNNGLMALVLQLLGSQTTTTTTPSTTTTISGIPAGFQFNTNLKLGATGNDVKYLQIFLNSDPATSIGNAGSETTYFGSMTQAAVVKFQNKYASEVLTPYGLTAGTGFFGTSTRAKANAMIGSVTTTTPTTTLPEGCTSTTGFSPVTGQSCSVASTLPAGCTSTTGFSSTTGQSCSTGTVSPVSGAFAVSLAATNPASSTLIQGQATANLAEYTFTNGTANPVKVTSLSLTRTGVSADSTLANVYLFDGAVRLTDAATLSSGVATYNNTNGIFTIPANSTKTISVKSDIATSTSGQTVGVSLSAITADGTLSSVLPVAASIHSIANATLATVSLSAALPTNAGTSTTSDPINDVRVWESTFSVNNRNVQFTKLALRQINSIDSKDVQNFRLLVDGVVVSTVASLDANGYVTFTFDKTLTTGSKNVKVLADITGGSSRAIQMSLRNKADIDVKDADYGVNISVTGAPNTADDIVVNSGAFSITANNAVLPITVANNASNVLIGKWTFKATGEAVKVETLKAGFTYGETAPVDNTSASLRNGKIMINGAQAGSTASLLQGGTEYSVNYTFQPGVETVVELYADIYDDNTNEASGLVTGDTILAKLIAGLANGTKQVSLSTMNVPTADSGASTIAVSSGSATLVKTTSIGDQNVVIPQQTPFKIGSWTMTAGTAEDLNISGLSFAIAGAGTFTVANMYDMYATYQIGSNAAVTTSVISSPIATQPFSSSFTLPKGQTVKIELFSKLNGTVTTSHTVAATLTVSGTGAQSGATADSSAVAGQTITAQTGSLAVTLDASSPIAALATGSTSSVKAASYKFEAQNDAYTVSQLNFALTGTSAITNVYVKDGSTVIASVAPAATVAVNLSTPITIPANSSKIISVEVDLGTIGTGAGATGSNVSVDLTSIIQRPASTGTAATVIPGINTSNVQYVYKSIPTVSLVSLPDTRLTVGTKTVQKFTVSADAKSSIAWNQINFTLAKSATTLTALDATLQTASTTTAALYDGTTLIPGTVQSSASLTGAATSGVVTFIPTAEQQIAAGTTKTYEFKLLVSGATTSGTYIMSSIASDAIQGTGAGDAAGNLTAHNFVWSDMSAQSHSTTTSDWTNGYLVKTLPTDTQSLTGAN